MEIVSFLQSAQTKPNMDTYRTNQISCQDEKSILTYIKVGWKKNKTPPKILRIFRIDRDEK